MKALLLKIRQNLHIILLFALIAVFYLSFGCPVRLLTGVSCPGCGMTRALFALLKLDFSLAFEMHPLVLLLIVYIIRMTQPGCVVYADFESGIIYKIINML